MPRPLSAAALGLGAVLAVVVAACVAVAEIGARPHVIAGPGIIQPMRIPARGLDGRLPEHAARGPGSVSFNVGTYGARPSTAVLVTVEGAGRSLVARCRISPDRYRDTGFVWCPVPDVAAARRVSIHLEQPRVPVAAFGDPTDRRAPVIGNVAVRPPSGFWSRVSTVLDRLSATRPALLGAGTQLAAGLLSVVALLGAAIVVRRPARDGSEAVRPGSEPAAPLPPSP